MHRALDRDGLERRTIAAHSRYIAALVRAERVQFDLRRTVPGVNECDLLAARSELDRCFFALRELLDTLGYTPRFTTRLPPEPGTDARR